MNASRVSFPIVKASSQTLLLGLLALTTVASSALAWHQHRKLIEMQALVARNAAERSEWQSRLPAAESAPLPSTFEFTGPAPVPTGGPSPADAITEALVERSDGPQRGGRGDRINPMATLMQNPEFARALVTQQKSALDQRYADLFRRLNLAPDQVDRLKDLLIERQSAAADVMAAARAQGVDGRENRDELRQLIQSTQAETEQAIKAFLGNSGYNEYQTYEQTQPQRALVNQLETKLSYSGAPLQAAQMDQLVQILAETSPQQAGGRGQWAMNFVAAGRGFDGGGPMPIGGGSGGVQITDDSIARAQGVLSQNQLQALEQMQAEQQAQRTMAEAVRNATRNNRPGEGVQGSPVPAPAAP